VAWLVQTGVSLLDASQLLRHVGIVIAQHYAHLALHNARATMEK